MPSLFKLLPDDEPKFIKRKQQARPAMSGIELYQSLVDPDYKLPTEFPSLKHEKIVSIDIESYDPGIQQGKGPAEHWPDSFVCGISIATGSGKNIYYPIRHKEGNNCDEEKVIQYIKEELLNPNIIITGCNLIYDLSYLNIKYGIKTKGTLYDIMIMDKLLDNTHDSYSLDSISKRYGFEGKKPQKMIDYCNARGWKYSRSPVEHCYKMHPSAVEEYAKEDTALCIPIAREAYKRLKDNNQLEVLEIEAGVTEVLLQMRETGANIDLKAAEQLYDRNKKLISVLHNKIGNINIHASADIKKLFDKKGYSYPLTSKGNASFSKEFFNKTDIPEAKIIKKLRALIKLNEDFVKGVVLERNINGVIYCSFNQIGTKTFRTSSQNPNLQQASGNKNYRQLFIAPDDEIMYSSDMSQCQLRIASHYAVGEGSEQIRRVYNEKPDTHFYKHIQAIAKKNNIDIEYDHIKRIILGTLFFMGVEKLSKELDMSISETKEIRPKLFNVVPFIKPTLDFFTRKGENEGYIRDSIGHVYWLKEWEPADFELSRKSGTFKIKEDAEKWLLDRKEIPAVKRAGAYRCLNAICQMEERSIIGKALHLANKENLFKFIRPTTIVHDDVSFLGKDDKETNQAFKRFVEILTTCIPYKVPILASAKKGKDWYSVH